MRLVEAIPGLVEYLKANWPTVLEHTLAHAALVLFAVGIAGVIGVGLGILTYRNRRARELALRVTGVILTIPSLALYALLITIPFLGIGATSVVVALTLYSLMPIVRNTVTGLRGVDEAVIDSARGMGMGRWRVLLRVELPLAWPVIVAGVRVSTLLLVGITAIAAAVNGPGLGEDIFSGLARIGGANALNLVLGGTLGIVLLALVFDSVFAGIGRLTTSKGIRD